MARTAKSTVSEGKYVLTINSVLDVSRADIDVLVGGMVGDEAERCLIDRVGDGLMERHAEVYTEGSFGDLMTYSYSYDGMTYLESEYLLSYYFRMGFSKVVIDLPHFKREIGINHHFDGYTVNEQGEIVREPKAEKVIRKFTKKPRARARAKAAKAPDYQRDPINSTVGDRFEESITNLKMMYTNELVNIASLDHQFLFINTELYVVFADSLGLPAMSIDVDCQVPQAKFILLPTGMEPFHKIVENLDLVDARLPLELYIKGVPEFSFEDYIAELTDGVTRFNKKSRQISVDAVGSLLDSLIK